MHTADVFEQNRHAGLSREGHDATTGTGGQGGYGGLSNYGDVTGERAGRLRTRKTPTTRTMITVTFKPTSMRYW